MVVVVVVLVTLAPFASTTVVPLLSALVVDEVVNPAELPLVIPLVILLVVVLVSVVLVRLVVLHAAARMSAEAARPVTMNRFFFCITGLLLAICVPCKTPT